MHGLCGIRCLIDLIVTMVDRYGVFVVSGCFDFWYRELLIFILGHDL